MVGHQNVDFLSMLNGVVGLFIILCAIFGIFYANRSEPQNEDKAMDDMNSDDSENQGML